MKMPTIHVLDDGPYQVKGSFNLVDAEGNSFEVDKDVSLCRCGYSDNKPFCDRTHEEIDFKSAPRVEDVFVEV
ncbi:CDGSH iron-sulfur domain-containing protein [Pseudogracilibacillus sp. SE30717A]|uniref:CDGSH iron-sulfur domain-containing protein n=1 Tax=Pseudogracilibacillus sp. SE30717A TaxID=3098293 RepID=UPI00300DC987